MTLISMVYYMICITVRTAVDSVHADDIYYSLYCR